MERRKNLLSTASLRSLVITSVAVASLGVMSACANTAHHGGAVENPPAAACNPCNPCAAACNPCAAACNPCAAACNPCAAACNPCNPCAAACNPCNPCAAYNPCAAHDVASGHFYDGPHAPGHKVSGDAKLVKDAEGHYWLHLTHFVSDEGPDVNIIMTPAKSPKTDLVVKEAGYITIADRQSLTGDQVYRLPDNFDPAAYHSVGIWCEKFGVLFGAAELKES